MTIILIMTLALPAKAAWFHAGWSNREKITVKSSQVNGDLSEFPVYLNLQDLPSSFFSTVNGTGADIRITQGDEISETSFELVELDTVNGEGELWFKAPSLSSSIDTDFYIYYGNGDASAYLDTDTYGTHNVWSNSYTAVYHMNEDPTGTILDSTSFSVGGPTAGGMVSTDLETGVVGKSLEFTHSQYIDISNVTLNSKTYVSFWHKPDDVLDAGAGFDGRSLLRYSSGNDGLQVTTSGRITEDRGTYLGGNGYQMSSDTDLYKLNSWNYSAVSVNGEAVIFFGEGKLYSYKNFLATPAVRTATDIARQDPTPDRNGFSGSLDEMHISNVPRNTNWHYSEHQNQKSPGNFYLINNGNHAGFDASFWTNKHKITIAASEINGDLTNFPVYLNFKDLPASFFATVNGNGADIRMTLADQSTQIPFELVNLDTANGEGELWFKAPNLSSTIDNYFYIWYGNSTAVAYDRDDEFGSENVWTEGFVGVWHMNEDPAGDVAYVMNDSTSLQNHGSPTGSMTSSDLVTGQVGSSIEFDGSNDYIIIDADNSLDFQAQMTIKAWVKRSVTGTQHSLVERYDWATPGQGGYVMRYLGSGQTQASVTENTSGDATTSLSTTPAGQWEYLSSTTDTDNNTIQLFKDGYLNSFNGSVSINPVATVTSLKLGARGDDGATRLNGLLDEITISQTVRSSNWISTEYSNQKSPGNFYLIENGNHAGFDKTLWSNSHKITILASEVNGDLSNFPVYVNLDHLPSSFFGIVDSNGADIRMTTNDQLTQIPFELVEVDTANGTGELWFKAPFISSSSDTDFYLWYGNPTAVAYDRDDEFGSENVWTEGYVGVWHMNEVGNSTSEGYNDSTVNQHHGTGASLMASAQVPTNLNKGQYFDGNLDYINLPNMGSHFTANGTLSAWLKTDTNTPSISSETGIWRFGAGSNRPHYPYTNNDLYIDAFRNDRLNSITNSFDKTTRHLLSITNSPGINNYKIYQNSQIISTATGENSITPATNYYIGRSDGAWYYKGEMDEVHLCNTARTDNWISAEYINQKDAKDFYNIDNGIEDTFDPADWSNKLKITLPADRYNGNLSEFPVYFNLQDLPNSFFSTIQSNGDDIRMTQGDALTQVALELVNIDAANGEGEIWFKAPFISSTVDNHFYIYYGNNVVNFEETNSNYGSEAVWSNGFVAVYHMNEDPTGAILDSTGFSNNGSSTGSMTSSDVVSGRIGNALDFDGVDDYIDLNSTLIPTNNFTVSYWASLDTLNRTEIVSQYNAGPNGRFSSYFLDSNEGYSMFLASGTNLALRAGPYNKINKWNHVVVTDRANDMSLYQHGLMVANGVVNQNIYQGINTYIGFADDINSYGDGQIDEVRIVDKPRSEDWVFTEYLNEQSPGNSYYIQNGDYAGFDQNFWSNYEKVTIPASEINGDLTNFPVFVNLKDFPTDFFSTVNGAGADIRVTNGNKMYQVPFELVELDTANGEGELWFKADLLSSTTDTDFYVWYGNPTAVAYDRDDEFGSENVWTEGYRAVYHMNEDPSGVINDSSSFRNHGTQVGGITISDLVKAKHLGKGVRFNGNTYISTPAILASSDTEFSMTSWADIDDLNSSSSAFFSQITNHGLRVLFSHNYSQLRVINGPGITRLPSSYPNADRESTQFVVEGIIGDNTSTKGKVQDMDLSPMTNQGGSYSSNINAIGSYDSATSSGMDGVISYFTLSNLTRSVDWYNVEYSNQSAPGNFYLINNGDDAGFDNTLWSNKHKITILASQVNGDLSNFPVYVDLDHLPASFFSIVDSNGADIRMTTNDQMTQIPFEIVELDIPEQKGELWFKAPFLSSSTDTNFYLWYGNPTAVAYDRDDEFGSENVWTEGYVGVWHLNEDPDSSNYLDSTHFNNDGNPVGLASDDPVPSQIGHSINLDGSAEYVHIPASTSLNVQEMTLSAWFKTDLTSQKPIIEYNSGALAGVHSWYNVGSWGGSGANFVDTGSTHHVIDDGDPTGVATGQWYYHSVSYDGTNNANFLLDGVLEANQALGSFTAQTSYDLFLGFRDNTNTYFNGSIDEVHIASLARNYDWTNAEYINQRKAKRFYNIDNGIEDDGDAWVSADWTNRLKITIEAAQVNGTHTDFPVFLDLADLPSSFFGVVNSDGSDIRMTNFDGQTRLPVEVVNIDIALERGELHFKAPLLTDALDNDFYIYYGNTNARMPNGADPLGSQAVWSNGYVAVYHMNQDPSQSTSLILDSTLYRNHGSVNGSMTLTDLVNGQMGMALDFDGTDDELFSPNDLNLSSGNNNFSIWFNSLENSSYIGLMGSARASHGWAIENHNGKVRTWYDATSSDSNAFVNTGTWQFISCNRNSISSDIYISGTLDQSTAGSTADINDGFSNFYVGSFGVAANVAESLIDEARVSNKVRSASWIWTEYNNQNTPSSFYTVEGTPDLNTDDNAPKVLKLSPDTKTINAPRRHPLKMLFDKVVNVATGNFNIYQENGNIFEAIDITSGQVTGGGTTELIITPSTYFTNAQTYYVLIDPAAIEDASSNEYPGIVDPETWKFTIQGGVRDEKPLFIFDGMI